MVSVKQIQHNEINRNLEFHNFYNLDINLNTYFAAQYYNEKNEDTNTPQELSIIFLDIEVYHKDKNIPFKFDESNHPISAISLNYNDDYYCYFLHKRAENLKLWEDDFKNDLIKDNYFSGNETITIFTYTDEKKLISDAWTKIRELQPFILSGFNSDNFDYPYIYRRLIKLYDGDTEVINKILSEFEYVEFRNNKYVEFPEFTICDILHLYKVREDGGLVI